jgi:hypothetical protein
MPISGTVAERGDHVELVLATSTQEAEHRNAPQPDAEAGDFTSCYAGDAGTGLGS